jgi:acylphosphatase
MGMTAMTPDETGTPPRLRWHGYVTGIVQGVGFRYFVHDEAQRLKVVGWVRNRSDGRVEVLAEGAKTSLEALIDRMRRGPRTARVESVAGEFHPATGEFSAFRLERTS